MLAGLVAITAPCAFVNAPSAVIIGLVSGVLVCWAVFFVEQVLRIDDPVGAIAVHGFNGAWGCLALGLFADGSYGDGWNGVPGTVKGLLFHGDASQLAAQCIGVATCIFWTGSAMFLFFKVQMLFTDIRVAPEVEIGGLDLPEMGALAYPDFPIAGTGYGGSGSRAGAGSAAVPVPHAK